MARSQNNPIEQRYAGRRALLMPRASTTKQTTSVEDQLKQMRLFAKRNGIIVVDKVGTAGISATKSWDRPDFDEVIARKQSINDFDLLIVYDATRFTRAGGINGASELRRMHANGIEVVFSSQEIADGMLGDMQLMQLFSMGQAEVEQRAKAICRGRQSSLESKRSLPFPETPFGTNRLISFSSGARRHVVRVTSDGSQIVFDGQTGDEIERFPPKVRGAGPRYIKQSQDNEELIPGDPAAVQIVQQIFQWKFIDNLSTNAIAKKLNEQGTPGVKGGFWSVGAIDTILRQPAYTGTVISGLSSAATFYRCAADEPEKVERDAKARAGVEAPHLSIRLPDDWTLIEQPQMVEFLPENIREQARIYAIYRLERRAKNAGKSRRRKDPHDRDRYKDSPFILTKILVEERCGMRMTGYSAKNYSYYMITRAASYPGTDIPKPHRIRSEMIDAAVLAALETMLSNTTALEDMVRAEVERQRRIASLSETQIKELMAESRRLDTDCEFIHKHRSKYGDEMTLKLVNDNRRRQAEIDQQIDAVDRLDELWGKNIDKKIRDLAVELAEASKWIRKGPAGAARRLVELFVSSATVNTETKEVNMEFRLPKRLYDNPQSVSLVTNLVLYAYQTSFYSYY